MPELSAEDLEQFQALLETLERELRKALALAEEGSRPVELDLPIGRLSRMDAMQQQSMAEAGRQAARLRLDQVRAARERLRAGRYGECLECEEPIGIARLRARPEAPLCLACQSSQEAARR
jgi:DnaK suppressor protein